MEHFIIRFLHNLLIEALPLATFGLIFHFNQTSLRASDRLGLRLLLSAMVLMSIALALDRPDQLSLRTKILLPLALAPPLMSIFANFVHTIMAGLRWNAQLKAAKAED